MKSEKSVDFGKQFKDLLALHERTLKYLESNKSDAVLIQNYKKLQSYLRNLSDDEIFTILNSKSKKSASNFVQPINELQDNEIEKLTIEQVKEEILNDKISKKYLDRIAGIRFGVTKSGASSLNREALIEKLQVLISNEKTHDTIARLASN
jgi:hypothetical protein